MNFIAPASICTVFFSLIQPLLSKDCFVTLAFSLIQLPFNQYSFYRPSFYIYTILFFSLIRLPLNKVYFITPSSICAVLFLFWNFFFLSSIFHLYIFFFFAPTSIYSLLFSSPQLLFKQHYLHHSNFH